MVAEPLGLLAMWLIRMQHVAWVLMGGSWELLLAGMWGLKKIAVLVGAWW
jgi:hypothetical protein